MHLCGTAFILQTLLSYYMLAGAVPASSHGDNAPTREWQARLEKEFRRSIDLSRQLLWKTRNLKCHYLSERLPGAQLAFVPHSGLFSLTSLNLQKWLSLSDDKRMSHLAKMLPFYQELVLKLKSYEADREDSKFLSQFEDLGFNLRDLSHQVTYQILLLGLPSENQPEPTARTPQILQDKNQWRNRQEVYIVLRHLESFLTRATREFCFLKHKVGM